MRTRFRSMMAAAAMMVMAVTVALLMAEGLLAVMGFGYDRVWEPDPQLGWHHVPGSQRHWTEEGDGLIRINALGFRDRDRVPEKGHDVFRIAVFGDSMTESVQVNLEDTFTYRLEEVFANGGRRIEVWNLGVNGYSPTQELLLFEKEVGRIKPDVVLWAVFLDNDIADMHRTLATSEGRAPMAVLDGDGVRFDYGGASRAYEEYHRQPYAWLREHVRLFRLFSEWRWKVRKRGGGGSAAVQADKVPTRFLLYKAVPDAAWEEAWTMFERVGAEFAKEAARQGVRFGIVNVPVSFRVSDQVWERMLRSYPAMRAETWDLEGPDRRLKQWAERQGLPLIDATAFLRSAGARGPLFWGEIGHFTPEGHALMTTLLATRVVETELVPGPVALGSGNTAVGHLALKSSFGE